MPKHLLVRVPHPWRGVLDWIFTIGGAIAIVLAIKAWVVNPYRIPTSSMEPTLHCARPSQDCEARTSDRVLANRFIYHFRNPRRGEIVVFNTPKLALQACGSEGTFVKRLIGLPGDLWREQDGFAYINGKRLRQPFVKVQRRDTLTLTLRDIPPAGHYTGMIPQGYYLMMGDNRKDSSAWSRARALSAQCSRSIGRSDASAEGSSSPDFCSSSASSLLPSSRGVAMRRRIEPDQNLGLRLTP